ncbi:hypothetical protein [Desulfatibacillum alkenivorans]|jgi:hypothetical protein|uniref:hypothetical protein n=1 Tax=Desulfatibacillum alkenivorans TaxID=259354 RepID=UPI00093697F8|nr:hypothetical protein [Desulfatibacillum alkenivorans]
MVLVELCAIMVASFGEEKVKGKPETIPGKEGSHKPHGIPCQAEICRPLICSWAKKKVFSGRVNL